MSGKSQAIMEARLTSMRDNVPLQMWSRLWSFTGKRRNWVARPLGEDPPPVVVGPWRKECVIDERKDP